MQRRDDDKEITITMNNLSIYEHYMQEYNFGNVALHVKDYTTGIIHYTKAIETDSKHPDAFNRRGICYRNINENDKALTDYTTAISVCSIDC
jgi:tetratricopeptide (TPR) repeat protein